MLDGFIGCFMRSTSNMEGRVGTTEGEGMVKGGIEEALCRASIEEEEEI
jgi:hypothetical protein